MMKDSSRKTARRIASVRWRTSLAIGALWCLSLPVAAAGGAPAGSHIDPSEIDEAVIAFTGAEVGKPGGPRLPSDRRLRLAACAEPLLTEWFGTARSTVQVSCSGPESWRIFIATSPLQGQAARNNVVKRGDALTILIRGRGFSVQQAGEAMESGAAGDWIFVRTSRKAEPLQARIERPGLAVIPAG
ncbi:flagella basal body P-ring formation protein FlgA [Erythrobacter sp.]|jgi:flagella basal body P-ring formation protein FlgA|uniref:flagella basal body P-ring formation protein FlgA n=1 Tax=Erythrobacter sp. TaxID=1042 RepID=UPI002E99C1FC|nr:flagella basal body P-ring formation protein FlgA [Erythrobacter sp.]